MRLLQRSLSAATQASTSERLITNHPTTSDAAQSHTTQRNAQSPVQRSKHHFSRWEVFFLDNPSVPTAFTMGTFMCLFVIIYAEWFSHKLLVCPEWAINCQVPPFVAWNKQQLAITQGIATVFFSAGLAIMAYSAQCLSEAAIWPLIKTQPFSVDGIDKFLNIVRGSVFLMYKTSDIALTRYTRFVLILTTILILAPLTAGPLVGMVWDRFDVPYAFESNYIRGGGAARIFAQDNPPMSLGSESMSNYISWSMGLSDEPLPDYRNYMVDRVSLAKIGNITVNAVYAQLDIACRPFVITEFPGRSPENTFGFFSTNMKKHDIDGRKWNSSDHVKVKLSEGMAIWANDFTFINRNASSVDLVFAAINGTIENGNTTMIPDPKIPSNMLPISAVCCEVKVELFDRVLQIGKGGPPLRKDQQMVTISSLDTIHIEFANNTNQRSPLNTLNENALWFAAGPAVLSPSVEGAQPMFTLEGGLERTYLPVPYTRGPYITDTPEHAEVAPIYTLESLTHFVNVSVGAITQACSRNFQDLQDVRNATVHSLAYTRKLVPWQVVYLAIPLSVMALGCFSLFSLDIYLHKKHRVTHMHMAPISEVINHHMEKVALSTVKGQAENHYVSEESPPISPIQQSPPRNSQYSMLPGKDVVNESTIELRSFERSSSDGLHREERYLV